jgi:peptidoglycan hydrolase CwlO-like protein
MDITPNDIPDMTEYLKDLIKDKEADIKCIQASVDDKRKKLLKSVYSLEMAVKSLEAMKADLSAITQPSKDTIEQYKDKWSDVDHAL